MASAHTFTSVRLARNSLPRDFKTAAAARVSASALQCCCLDTAWSRLEGFLQRPDLVALSLSGNSQEQPPETLGEGEETSPFTKDDFPSTPDARVLCSSLVPRRDSAFPGVGRDFSAESDLHDRLCLHLNEEEAGLSGRSLASSSFADPRRTPRSSSPSEGEALVGEIKLCQGWGGGQTPRRRSARREGRECSEAPSARPLCDALRGDARFCSAFCWGPCQCRGDCSLRTRRLVTEFLRCRRPAKKASFPRSAVSQLEACLFFCSPSFSPALF